MFFASRFVVGHSGPFLLPCSRSEFLFLVHSFRRNPFRMAVRSGTDRTFLYFRLRIDPDRIQENLPCGGLVQYPENQCSAGQKPETCLRRPQAMTQITLLYISEPAARLPLLRGFHFAGHGRAQGRAAVRLPDLPDKISNRSVGQDAGFPRTQNGDRARYDLTGDRKFSRPGHFMPRVGFPRSPQDTRKTQGTPIPAVLGKTLTDFLSLALFSKKTFSALDNSLFACILSSHFLKTGRI